MSKLAESYVEFVAKGLTELENDIQNLDKQVHTASKATEVLDQCFSNLSINAKKLTAGVRLQTEALHNSTYAAQDALESGLKYAVSVANLTTLEKSLEAGLIATDESFRKNVASLAIAEAKQKDFANQSQNLVGKLLAVDKEMISLTAREMAFNAEQQTTNKTLELNAKNLLLVTGETKKLALGAKDLEAQEAKASLAVARLNADLIKSDKGFKDATLSIMNMAKEEQLLSMKTQLATTNLIGMDKASINLLANEKLLADKINLSQRALDLKASALKASSIEATLLLKATALLNKEESNLLLVESQMQANLMAKDKSYSNISLAIEKNTAKIKNNNDANQILLLKLKSIDIEALKLTAVEKKQTAEIELSTKAFQIQADRINILTGVSKALTKETVGLIAQEAKNSIAVKTLELDLLKTDGAFRQHIKIIEQAKLTEASLANQTEMVVSRMRAMDDSTIKLTANIANQNKSIENSNRFMEQKVKALNLVSEETKKNAQASMLLDANDAKLSLKTKELTANLLANNSAYQKAAIEIANCATKEMLLDSQSQVLILKLKAMDANTIKLTADIASQNKTIENSNRFMEQKVKALNLVSGETKKNAQASMLLDANDAKLSLKTKELTSNLLATNTAFQKAATEIANCATKEGLLDSQSQVLISRLKAVDAQTIKMTADTMANNGAIDNATKKLELESRQLNLLSGAYATAAKEGEALLKLEEKIAAQEAKARGVVEAVAPPKAEKEVKPAKEAKVKEEKEVKLKAVKDPKAVKIKVDSQEVPKAEKALDKLGARLKGMGATALVAGAAVSGAVGMLIRSASSGTVEGEHLAKSFETLGKVVGDIFAPYVRIATDLLNKASRYFMALSSSTKELIGKIAIVTAGAAAFAAVLPTLISGVSALFGLISAIASPIGLVGVALVALGGYFAGVFDSTKSWEEVLASFIGFFLDVWTRAQDAFDKFCNAIVSQYDSTVKPMLDGMQEAWASVSDSIGEVVDYLAETIASFFGTSVEDASTFQGVMSTVVEAWLDLQTAADAVISALSDGFMWIYEKAVKPTISFILDAFKLVWGYVKEVADGIFGAFESATGGIISSIGSAIKFMFSSWKNFTKTVVSLVFTIYETFAEIVNKISDMWWGMINKLAKAAAWILEKMGIISKETADKMREAGKGDTDIFDVAGMRKKMDGYLDKMGVQMEENKDKAKELGGAINDFINPPVGSDLGKALEDNTEKAKKMARAIVGTIKGGLEKPGGFQIKANVAFEGLGATFDRLQLAFANSGTENIDQAQLVQMQGINQNMQVAAAALGQIKDKIPAVR